MLNMHDRDCPDKMAESHSCQDLQRITNERDLLKKALEKIVAMDAVTEEERQHYWTDRAERMRDTAMIALGGEKPASLSERLESARRSLSYIQDGAKDLDDAKRAAEYALKYLPLPGDKQTEKRVQPLPKKCEHGPWIPDGDRDVCQKCGTRANPTI